MGPELRPVVLAARHAVAEFLEGELERRRDLGYPPFRRLVRVLAAAHSATSPTASPPLSAAAAEPALEGDILLGPAPLLRLRDRSRSHVLIKTQAPPRGRPFCAACCATSPPTCAGRRDGRGGRGSAVVLVSR